MQKRKYMSGCIRIHSYVCFMSKRFPEALSEEESSELHAKDYEMQSQRLRNTKLGGVFVYLNPGRKKDAITKQQTSRITLGSMCQLLNYCHIDNEKEYKPTRRFTFGRLKQLTSLRIIQLEFIHFALFDNSSCLERETAHSLSVTCASSPF